MGTTPPRQNTLQEELERVRRQRQEVGKGDPTLEEIQDWPPESVFKRAEAAGLFGGAPPAGPRPLGELAREAFPLRRVSPQENVQSFQAFLDLVGQPFQALTQFVRPPEDQPPFPSMFGMTQYALRKRPPESPTELPADASAFQRLVQAEREEPLISQLIGGFLTDPTALVPGLGFTSLPRRAARTLPAVAPVAGATSRTAAFRAPGSLAPVPARIAQGVPAPPPGAIVREVAEPVPPPAVVPEQRGTIQREARAAEIARGQQALPETTPPMPLREEAEAERTPLELAQQQLDEATAGLEAESAPGMPVPRFGTPERAAFDAERRAAASEGRPVVPKLQRVSRARERVRQAQGEVQRLETEARVVQQGVTGQVPPPPRPPGVALGDSMSAPPPRQVDVGLADDLDIPSFEAPVRGIFRKWEGARNVAGLDIERRFRQGVQLLRQVGVRQFSRDTMLPVFRALHGEISPDELSENLRPIYNDLRETWVAPETTEHLAFLAGAQNTPGRMLGQTEATRQTNAFLTHEDYFSSLWKRGPPGAIGARRGTLGAIPGFARARREATFSEMLEEGFEPASWNPYAMAARRRLAGVEYREQVRLANRLIQQGMALPFDEAPEAVAIGAREPTGRLAAGLGRELGVGLPPPPYIPDRPWRVPRVGPVFEGKVIPGQVTGEDTILITKPIAVPAEVADLLEDAYGADVGSAAQFFRGLRRWSNVPKRMKLFGSLFQHIDLTARAVGVSFSPTGLQRLAPFRTPSMLGRLVNLQFNPLARQALERQVLSDAPRYPGGPSYRMVIEEGWGLRGDISIINRGFTDLVNQAVQESRSPLKYAQKAVQFWEKGLFDGVYREAQRWALDELVLPWLRRTRTDASPRQIAAEAAETVNLIFSTVENWQTVFQNPAMREAVRSVLFSANESEALIRTSLRALGKHPQAGLFREWWIGFAIATVGMANVINVAATGKPLPASSYNPVRLNDPYAPFTVGYNNRFLSPQIPFIKGRNNVPVHIDLVGQMDTLFRWALDPSSALAARLNVPERAIINQMQGETFFGEKLDTPLKRLIQLAVDVGAPISALNLVGAGVGSLPEAVQEAIPQQEPRLGPVGQAVQASGVNLRTLSTPELTDPMSIAIYRKPYHELTVAQQNTVKRLLPSDIREELKLRGEETRRKLFGAPKKK